MSPFLSLAGLPVLATLSGCALFHNVVHGFFLAGVLSVCTVYSLAVSVCLAVSVSVCT